MRHKVKGRKLNRSAAHRKAMFRNMAKSFLTYERIRTTEAKAKELRIVADKLITLALQETVSARRQAYKILENHALVKKLFDEIGPRYKGGSGGYTRIVKFGLPRTGDSAPMALIELTAPAPQAETSEKADAVEPEVVEAAAE